MNIVRIYEHNNILERGEFLNYITIDTGTTNTRVRYVEDNKILASYKDGTGVKDTAIIGSLDKLKNSMKKGIDECLESSGDRKSVV